MNSRKDKQTAGMYPGEAGRLPHMSRFSELGHLIKISCTWCRTSHFYDPADMITLLGDVPLLNIEINFRCSGCGKKEYMMSDVEFPPARERIGLTVRRLVEVRTVRRPIWKDVKL